MLHFTLVQVENHHDSKNSMDDKIHRPQDSRHRAKRRKFRESNFSVTG